MKTNNQVPNDQIEDYKWKSLYKVGAWSALIIGSLFTIELIVYIASSAPSLADAAGWLTLFQKNRLLGLVDFGILEFYGLVLFVPMFLALYTSLRRVSEGYMSIAAILAFTGIAVNFATSKLFCLLSLSDLYASAGTDVQRSQFLAAAQAALAQSAQGGIGGGVEGGIPLAVAGLIISTVMLRSKILDKSTAYVGFLANGTGLVMYISAAAATAFGGSPFFGLFFLLSVAWFFLIARGLFQLGRIDSPQASSMNG
jgi:hypothetical protein